MPKVTMIGEVQKIILNDFQFAYSNMYVVKKSFWWIVAVTGHILVSKLQYKHVLLNCDKFKLISYFLIIGGNIYSNFMGEFES